MYLLSILYKSAANSFFKDCILGRNLSYRHPYWARGDFASRFHDDSCQGIIWQESRRRRRIYIPYYVRSHPIANFISEINITLASLSLQSSALSYLVATLHPRTQSLTA